VLNTTLNEMGAAASAEYSTKNICRGDIWIQVNRVVYVHYALLWGHNLE